MVCPSLFEQLSHIEKLDNLIQKYEQKNPGIAHAKNPIGITSSSLEGNIFSITSTIPAVKFSVISAADWKTRFAPPSIYEYLLHMILLTTIRYRLHEVGARINEHSVDDYSEAYFDKVMEKNDLSNIICNGHFKEEDKEIIREFLGKEAFDSYEYVLSLSWLQDENLQKRVHFRPECFK